MFRSRAGILVLVNGADWELEGGGDSAIKDNDEVGERALLFEAPERTCRRLLSYQLCTVDDAAAAQRAQRKAAITATVVKPSFGLQHVGELLYLIRYAARAVMACWYASHSPALQVTGRVQ